MARKAKYHWPEDQELQALLDEHGTVETARLVGCPPRSLSNRIRRRGLRRPKQSGKANGAGGNGLPFEANADSQPESESADGKPEAESSNGKPDVVTSIDDRGDEPAGERKPSKEKKPTKEKVGGRNDAVASGRRESGRERRPRPKPEESRRRALESFEYIGSADYQVRGKSESAATADSGLEKGDSSASQFASQLASHSKLALTLLRRVPPPVWRVLAVIGLAAVAGIAAFISVSSDPKTFERESSFAVRPSETVPPAAINDVLGTLAQPDSAITETIVNMFGSPRLRNFAAQAAGVPPSSVGGSGAEYGWSATRRTGSTIIDMRLTGPDDDKLRAMETAAGPEAARLVEASYPPYRLETLSAPSPPVQVGPKTARTVGLAVLLGALLGITLVLAERRLRLSLAQREAPSRAPRGQPWER